MQLIFVHGRWMVFVKWGWSLMYLDPMKAEIIAPNGDIYARYDNKSGQFRFIVNSEMLEPLPESINTQLKEQYTSAYQMITFRSN